MMIYKMTHVPTGKFYLGSLKDSTRWESYSTSSEIVKPMLAANPDEWQREVLRDTFPNDWSFEDVVNLENEMIKEAIETYGLEGVWNQAYVLKCGKLFSFP